MRTGIKGEAHTYVNQDNTAAAMKSGTLDVLATPAVVALIEQACQESVAGELEADETTVGIYVCIEHMAATAVGKEVRAESMLVNVDNRRLLFEALVYDGDKLIAKGTHERCVVNTERFLSKLNPNNL